jgi:hypothetical protein
MGQALSWGRSLPSPAWTLVTPYCKRTRPGRGTNTKAAGFPPLSRPSPATSLPPFALGLASTHLGWGTRRHSLVGLGTPRSRNADRKLIMSNDKTNINIIAFNNTLGQQAKSGHPLATCFAPPRALGCNLGLCHLNPFLLGPKASRSLSVVRCHPMVTTKSVEYKS